MMMVMWAISSVVATIMAVSIIMEQAGSSFEWKDLFLDNENLQILGIAMVLPALMFMGMVIAKVWDVVTSRNRYRVRRIVRDWENVSVDYSDLKVKASESDYKSVITAMRSQMSKISYKDLKFLAGLDPDHHKVDKIIMDAILDELVERQLFK